MDYRFYREKMTFYEARDFCLEHDMKLASTTDDTLLESVLQIKQSRVWLDLIEPEAICKNTKCYAWQQSPYTTFNRAVEWKKRPSFRYTSCRTKLPFLCVGKKKVEEEKETGTTSCSSSAAEIVKSKDEHFPSSVKFNLGLDTARLVRDIGLDRIGVDLDGHTDYVIAIQTTLWPKDDSINLNNVDNVEETAKRLIHNQAGVTFFGIGEMQMNLADMATSLMLSKAKKVAPKPTIATDNSTKTESLFFESSSIFDSFNPKRLELMTDKLENCTEVIEEYEEQAKTMKATLQQYRSVNKKQRAEIEHYEQQVENERYEKETTVVEKERKVESLNNLAFGKSQKNLSKMPK